MNKRHLVKLMEFAQADLKHHMREKTRKKIRDNFAEWFAVDSTQRREVYDSGDDPDFILQDLKEWQDELRPLIKLIAGWVELKGKTFAFITYKSKVRIIVTNDRFTSSYMRFKNELFDFLRRGIHHYALDQFKICQECGNIFLQAGKREKKFCSQICITDHFQ